MSSLSLLAIVLGVAAMAVADSLTVVNECNEQLYLFTQTSYGTINGNIFINPGQTIDIGKSDLWVGAISVGTGCNGDASSCTTGGPGWGGDTPYSRAEFNFGGTHNPINYDISLIYGYNVGMEIAPADTSCPAFACTLPPGQCPVPGPDGSCYSSCCATAQACQTGGALPAGFGGCVKNGGPGPNSVWYNSVCPNAYAYPDNDGADGYPSSDVDATCANNDVTLTLCPGTTSHYT